MPDHIGVLRDGARGSFNIVYVVCSHMFRPISPLVGRYVYGVMFLITCFFAWVVRDFGVSLLSDLQKLKICSAERNCVGADGVLRVSFGCSIFFLAMFFSTAGTKRLDDPRETWHSGWWPAKILLWVTSMGIPFYLPFSLVQIYGEAAHYGAGVFLLIQLVSIISFIRCVDDYFQSEKRKFTGMVVTTSSLVLCTAGILFMYLRYAPNHTCTVNIILITSTMLIVVCMTFMPLKLPKENVGFLTPSVMGLYLVFLCWSAIRSEPLGHRCERSPDDDVKKRKDWITVISFLIALLAMVVAAFTTAIDSQCFKLKKESNDVDRIPYGYGFFHLVFATAAMYLAMLLVSWNASHSMRRFTMDVSLTSTWVRIVNEVAAVVVYMLVVVYPAIIRDRET